MKNKKGWLIMLRIFIFLVALAIGSFVLYQQTGILRQQGSNIEYLIITQKNFHSEDDFKIKVEDIEIIESLYNTIQSTAINRFFFPSHQGSMRENPRWVIQTHYQNGRQDDIFIVHGGLFYRWLPTGRNYPGFVIGFNENLMTIIIDIFDELGYNERPRFREIEISDNLWSEAEHIYIPNSDFSFLIGQELYTQEEAEKVANIILETEQNDESQMEHAGNFILSRRDFFDGFELMLIEHDKQSGIWLFSFWVDEMRVASNSFRVAFNGNTGEIIKMWIERM